MGQKNESFGTVCPQGAKLSSEAELKIGYHREKVGLLPGLPLNETRKNLTLEIPATANHHRFR